ncbi:hypothetical protein D8674_025333 [Pyrus ussuriensis x Pyrus communis]|uniref:Uncharacterized protein n=1 Tax=Pyrus ussuriensis x Pyrus communis TaxID=2448454 RepID=A0A5N5HAE5_9ROSA|nr:hypothetical protein D8674_025333 [Pyrus ussuriensis x Pyrus communis]
MKKIGSKRKLQDEGLSQSGKRRLMAPKSSNTPEEMEGELKEKRQNMRLENKEIDDKSRFLCAKVEEIFNGDVDKYVEFLEQLHQYSQKVVDLTEFLNIVDDSVRADEPLMNELESLLERCQEAQKEWPSCSRPSKRLKI